MEKRLRTKMNSILRILASGDRLPGYRVLKSTRVIPQLRRAIRKMREGSYGRCDDCSNAIPEERLKAAPGATRCLKCQEIFERTFLGRHL